MEVKDTSLTKGNYKARKKQRQGKEQKTKSNEGKQSGGNRRQVLGEVIIGREEQ